MTAPLAAEHLAAELRRHAFGNATTADVEAAFARLVKAMREWREW